MIHPTPTPSWLSRNAWWLISSLGVLVIVCWWEIRIERPPTTEVMFSYLIDQYEIYKPTLLHASEELSDGRIPLWDPWRGAGLPHLAIQQLHMLYPPHWLHLIFDFRVANSIVTIFHYCLAFVAFLFLCRTIRLSWSASVVGAANFTFSGVMQWYLMQNPFLIHASLLPLCVGLTERLLESGRRRWAALLAVAMALQYMGGHPSFALMALYAVAITFLFHAILRLRAREMRTLLERTGLLAATGGVSLLLIAWHLLPFSESVLLSSRAPGLLTIDMANYIKGLLSPSLIGVSMASAGPAKMPTFNVGYFGVMSFLLLPFALAYRQRVERVCLYLAITIFFALLALAEVTPLYALFFHYFPSGSMSRMPAYYMLLVSLGFSLLAALGCDSYLTMTRRARLIGVVVASLVTIPVGALIDLREVLGAFALFGYQTFSSIHMVQVFALLGTALLIFMAVLPGARGRRVAAILLPLAVAADVVLSYGNDLPIISTRPDFYRAPDGLADDLRELQRDGLERAYLHCEYDLGKVMPEGPVKLPQNLGLDQRVFVVGFYEIIFPLRYTEFYRYMERGPGLELGVEERTTRLPAGMVIVPTTPQGRFRLDPAMPSIRLLDLLGARYIVETRDDPFPGHAGPDARYPILKEAPEYVIRENPRALPRAYIVPQAEVLTQSEAILARLAAPDFDPRRSVVVEEPIDGAGAAARAAPFRGEARIERYDETEVVIATESDEDGFLVLTDQFFPGWQAEIDGAETEILRGNYLFRTLRLPRGRHRVTFRYRPRLFLYGGALSLAGLACLAVLSGGVPLRGRG